MPVTYLIKFQVVPERRDQFLKLLGDVLDAMRSEPTFHQAILHRGPTDEDASCCTRHGRATRTS
jgi:quinol monooxygenase YgiN